MTWVRRYLFTALLATWTVVAVALAVWRPTRPWGLLLCGGPVYIVARVIVLTVRDSRVAGRARPRRPGRRRRR